MKATCGREGREEKKIGLTYQIGFCVGVLVRPVSRDPCDACGTYVQISGGIDNLWTFSDDEAGGMTLEFAADGTEHFLCFDCIELLPDDPTAEDVAAIDEAE